MLVVNNIVACLTPSIKLYVVESFEGLQLSRGLSIPPKTFSEPLPRQLCEVFCQPTPFADIQGKRLGQRGAAETGPEENATEDGGHRHKQRSVALL